MNLSYFLNKGPERILAVDFSEETVSIACLEKDSRGCKLIDFSFTKILSLKESRGNILKFINDFIAKNQIEKKEVYLTIPPVKAISIIILDLPALPKPEVLPAAKWQLKDMLPFELSRSVLSWDICREYTDKEGAKMHKVVFAVAEKRVLDEYLSIALDSGLGLLNVSASSFDYGLVLGELNKGQKQQAVLEIRSSYAVLYIYREGKLIFIRKLLFSSEKVIRSLEGILALEKKEIKLSYDQAKKIKEDIGIPKNPNQTIKGVKAIKFFSLMRPLLEELAKDIIRSFDYFKTTFGLEISDTLYISGSTTLKNLGWYLSKEINIKTALLPLPSFVDIKAVDKNVLVKNYGNLLAVLSPGLKEEKAINLLPQNLKAKKRKFVQGVSLRAGILLTLLVFFILFFSLEIKKDDYQARLINLQLYLETVKEVRRINEKIGEYQNLLEVVKSEKIPVDGLVKLISRKISPNIILDELFFDQNENILILKGVVSVSGGVAESILIDFIEKIESSPVFLRANLAEYRKDRDAKRFEIRCELAG